MVGNICSGGTRGREVWQKQGREGMISHPGFQHVWHGRMQDSDFEVTCLSSHIISQILYEEGVVYLSFDWAAQPD